jgi:hypothetical protein
MEENQEMSVEVEEVHTASHKVIRFFISLLVILMAVIIAVLAGVPIPRPRKTGTDAETFHLIPYQYAFPSYGSISNLSGLPKGRRMEKGYGYRVSCGDLVIGDVYVVDDQGNRTDPLFDSNDDTFQMFFLTEDMIVTPANQGGYIQPCVTPELIITWTDLIQSNYDYKWVNTVTYPGNTIVSFGLTM